jgi:hypothetical protein
MSYDLELTGGLFGAGAPGLIQDAIDEAVYQVAAQALADVQQTLDVRIVNPTPYYETQITLTRHSDSVVVHDRGVIYGPWLEGVSPRNARTRFKGYHAFRIAKQNMETNLEDFVGRVIDPYIDRLV